MFDNKTSSSPLHLHFINSSNQSALVFIATCFQANQPISQINQSVGRVHEPGRKDQHTGWCECTYRPIINLESTYLFHQHVDEVKQLHSAMS